MSRLPSNDAQMCPTHSNALSVYCETCRNAICYKCALFSGKHKEHSFQPLDKLHKKHKLALETELCKLRDRMRDILSFVLQVEKKVEVVRVSKSKVCVFVCLLVVCSHVATLYVHVYRPRGRCNNLWRNSTTKLTVVLKTNSANWKVDDILLSLSPLSSLPLPSLLPPSLLPPSPFPSPPSMCDCVFVYL